MNTKNVPPTVYAVGEDLGAKTALTLLKLRSELGEKFFFHPLLPLAEMLRWNTSLAGLWRVAPVGRTAGGAVRQELLTMLNEARKLASMKQANGPVPEVAIPFLDELLARCDA